jgi:hypothetical protein
MEAVAQPHENWKTMLLQGRLRMQHVEACAGLLADLHVESRKRASEIAVAFGDRSFFETLRIEPYYLYAAEKVPSARTFLTELVMSTREHQLCLVHGDFSPKNILVRADKLVLLDHEVAHFGDPAFDIGFSAAHLLSKANHLDEHRVAFHDASIRYWTVYWSRLCTEAWARDLESRAVRNILACLLARVAGRSLLEYLSEAQRERQQRVVLELITKPPNGVPDLVTRFVRSL